MYKKRLLGMLALILVLPLLAQAHDKTSSLLATAGNNPKLGGGDYALEDTAGNPATAKNFTGNGYNIVFFGFTKCEDVCPATLSALALARQSMPLALQAKWHLVFVAIDPRDTPQLTATYLQRFDKSFVGWTGSPQQVSRMAASFIAYYKVETKDTQTTIHHANVLYVMGPDGQYITHLDGTNTPEVLRARLQEIIK